MKDKTVKKYITAFIVAAIFSFTVITHKYNSLKLDYHKAEADKVEYCRKYNEIECKYENLKDSLDRIYRKL